MKDFAKKYPNGAMTMTRSEPEILPPADSKKTCLIRNRILIPKNVSDWWKVFFGIPGLIQALLIQKPFLIGKLLLIGEKFSPAPAGGSD